MTTNKRAHFSFEDFLILKRRGTFNFSSSVLKTKCQKFVRSEIRDGKICCLAGGSPGRKPCFIFTIFGFCLKSSRCIFNFQFEIQTDSSNLETVKDQWMKTKIHGKPIFINPQNSTELSGRSKFTKTRKNYSKHRSY